MKYNRIKSLNIFSNGSIVCSSVFFTKKKQIKFFEKDYYTLNKKVFSNNNIKLDYSSLYKNKYFNFI